MILPNRHDFCLDQNTWPGKCLPEASDPSRRAQHEVH